MAPSLLDLPQDILVEILSRLPLASLFTCRRVCKTFLLLTLPKNPNFTDLQSSILVAHDGDKHNEFYLMEPQLHATIASSKSLLILKRIEHSVYRLPKFLPSIWSYTIANSCNGLLYLKMNGLDSTVWNPITDECLVVLDPDYGKGRERKTLGMWLGYSHGDNRYKVMKLFKTSAHEEVLTLEAKVLNFGSKSWRNIEVMPVFYHHYQQYYADCLYDSDYPFIHACYARVDGTIYWGFELFKEYVYFFDFEKEEFGVIESPTDDGRPKVDTRRVGLLGGRLCLSYNYRLLGQKVLWMLEKTAGNERSWREKCVVKDAGIWRFWWQFKLIKDLFCGDVFMVTPESNIVCYDPKNKSSRVVVFHTIVKGRHKHRIIFVDIIPSFIPLKVALKLGDDKGMILRKRKKNRYVL